MEEKKIIIAIDGFSSTGKSTMAKALAKALNYAYVDTGAMYRAVTLYCLDNGLFDGETVDEPALQQHLDDIHITFRPNDAGRSDTYLNGVNVEQEIRSMRVSDKVSIIAAIAFVRHDMVRQQQEMGRDKGLVMDGRDIGTVVFPNAELKVFVTADPMVRAQRRYDELRGKGDTTTTFEEVLENVTERDRIDTTRAEGPLRQADDALVLDNSNLTIPEQNAYLLGAAHATINAQRKNGD
jgi:cytidylate kinase